jgi:hypothetical protein
MFALGHRDFQPKSFITMDGMRRRCKASSGKSECVGSAEDEDPTSDPLK